MGRYGWAGEAAKMTGVAGGGAILGWAICADFATAAREDQNKCMPLFLDHKPMLFWNQQLCIPVIPWADVMWLPLAVVSCWVIMAAGRVRPLPLTVPAAIVVTILVTALWPAHGWMLRPAWAFSLATGSGLLLVASSAAWLRAWRREPTS